MGQRKVCGLQRGQQNGGGVRPDPLPETGAKEPDSLPSVPLVRRQLLGGPGFLPLQRRITRLLPLRAPRQADRRPSGHSRLGRPVSGRDTGSPYGCKGQGPHYTRITRCPWGNRLHERSPRNGNPIRRHAGEEPA